MVSRELLRIEYRLDRVLWQDPDQDQLDIWTATLAGRPGVRAERDWCHATVTVEQAGALLGISRRSAYRAAAAGHIPTIRLGRRILVPTAALYRMLGIIPHTAPTQTGPDTRAARSRRHHQELGDNGHSRYPGYRWVSWPLMTWLPR